MTPSLQIIPEPKEVCLDDGTIHLDEGFHVYATPEAYGAAERLAAALGKGDVATLVDDVPVVLVAREMPAGRQEPSSVDRSEGYDLDIGPDRIVIRGADAGGAFYGVQTLLQMLADHDELPIGHIRDWPDLAVRGVHFDLKGCMPTFEYLKATVERLAHYKVNTILMEYEDRLAYPGHPALAAPSALTMDQAAELERVARANFVQIVPLLQCLGHAEYILRRPEYAHLRETDDHVQQMCPLKPETLAFFKERADHLMALHPDSAYFHAGGDETRQLGECPACKARLAEVGPWRLYFDYVKQCCEYIVAKGRRPVIWDDILTRQAPELIGELPQSTVLMYWLYRIHGPTQPSVYYGSWCTAAERWRHKPYDRPAELPPAVTQTFEALSPREYAFFQKYADTDRFPEAVSSTVFLRFMQEQGVAVMGASAAQPSEDGLAADPERGIPNIRTWARAIHAAGELGVVSTAWTRSASLTPLNGMMEGMWLPFLASAEWYWSVEGADERRFDEKANRRLFGLDSLEGTDAVWLIRHRRLAPKRVGEMFADLAARAPESNRDLLAYYAVMADVIHWQDDLRDHLWRSHYAHYASRHQMLTPRDRRRQEEALDGLRARSAALRKRVREAYARALHPHDVEDALASIFEWPEDLLALLQRMLDECPR